MTTILGKSAIRTESLNKMPVRVGARPKTRVLEVICEGGEVFLHMHTPTNIEGGWALTVSATELLAALKICQYSQV